MNDIALKKVPGNVNVAIVGVDVSSVCRDPCLPRPVGLHRLDLVLNAWRTQLCRHAEFHLVADRSLRDELSKDDRRQLKEMGRGNGLQVKHEADDVILDQAEASGGCVVSLDRFLDKRRGRQWVPERFFTWTVGDGEVRIARYQSKNTQSFDISRKLEQKLASERGIPDLRHPAVSRRWACVSDGPCLTRESTPDVLQTLPLVAGKRILCPGCLQTLEERGPRSSEAELKLLLDERFLGRFTIKQGQTIAFGRQALPDSAELAELAQKGAFANVGRVHAHLRILGKRLAVQPADARHRVWVRPWDSNRRRFERVRRLAPTGYTPIGLRDVLLIGDQLSLVRSGRSVAEEEELMPGDQRADWRRHGTAKT